MRLPSHGIWVIRQRHHLQENLNPEPIAQQGDEASLLGVTGLQVIRDVDCYALKEGCWFQGQSESNNRKYQRHPPSNLF